MTNKKREYNIAVLNLSAPCIIVVYSCMTVGSGISTTMAGACSLECQLERESSKRLVKTGAKDAGTTDMHTLPCTYSWWRNLLSYSQLCMVRCVIAQKLRFVNSCFKDV